MSKLLKQLPSLSKLVSLLFICLLIFSQAEGIATAYSDEGLNAIKTNTPHYLEGYCQLDGGGNAAPLNGTDNISKIYNYFIGKGLPDFQAAGIMGSMKGESGFEPQRAQGIFDRLVDADHWQEAKGGGWGLVQWTPGSKMIDPVKAAGKDPNDLSVQLDYLWGQLNNKWPDGWPGGPPSGGFNEKAAGDELKASQDLTAATVAFELKYERHAPPPQPERVVEAQKVLDLAKAGGTGGGTNSDPIYILGDSITARSATKYKSVFPNAIISARVGRSWISGGQEDSFNTGTQGPANTALSTDAAVIKEKAVKTVIVALGTNGFENGNPIDEIIKQVGETAPGAKIYWVNVASAVPGSVPAFNAALKQRQDAGKITVVDWAKVVDPTGDGTNNPKQILDDRTHPHIDNVPNTQKTGVDMLVELVSGALGSGGGGTAAGSGKCECNPSNSASNSGISNSSDVTDLSYTDDSRGGRPVGVSVWKPDGAGKHPLVMFAPGRNQNSKADGYYKRYLKAIASQGFVVAGLNFSDNNNPGAAPSDADDVKFAIDKVLAEEQFKTSIDPSAIGMIGHSDGGFVAGLVGYADNKKDSRIRAVILENGGGYAGYTYASGPALLGMLGTNDADNAGAVTNAYNSIKTPYNALAKFKGADHDQYIVSDTSEYKDGVDAITAAFLNRILKSQANSENGLNKVAETYKDKLDFESKTSNEIDAAAKATADDAATAAACAGSGGGNVEGLSATILAYAWPEYRASYKPQMPAYQEVVKNAKAKDQFIGGNQYPGDDCGGFVTRALVDSGFLPGYNNGGLVSKGASNTWGNQIPWADANMQLIGQVTSSSQLQPGDVAFDSDGGHTWMFVGKIDGFKSEIASASFDDRAPMAGTEGITYNGARWYRKK